MKKKISIILAFLLIAAMLFGCGDNQKGTPEQASNKEISSVKTTEASSTSEPIIYKNVTASPTRILHMPDWSVVSEQKMDKSIYFTVPDEWDGDSNNGIEFTSRYSGGETLIFEGFDVIFTFVGYEPMPFDKYIIIHYYRDTAQEVESPPILAGYKDYTVTEGISKNGYPYVLYDNREKLMKENIDSVFVDCTLFMQITERYIIVADILAYHPSIVQTLVDSVEYK